MHTSAGQQFLFDIINNSAVGGKSYLEMCQHIDFQGGGFIDSRELLTSNQGGLLSLDESPKPGFSFRVLCFVRLDFV